MHRRNICRVPFGGEKADQNTCELSPSNLFKSNNVVLIGNVLELVCETPLEKNCNSINLVKSSGPLIAVSTDNHKYTLIVPSDKVSLVSKDLSELKKASKLHEDFHGVDPTQTSTPVKSISINDKPEYLIFYGHLNYIVYSVPAYSARYQGSQGLPSGTPFKHEGRDRGDDKPKARKKPIVCVSPDRDYAVIYGSQYHFGEKGMVG